LPCKLDEHRKAAVAFDERRDVRVACSGKKISFPMARNGAILGLGGSLAGKDHIEYVPPALLGLAPLGVAHVPPCTQLCRQLLLQHAARLNKETAIDRFVRYPHVSVSVGNCCFSQPEICSGDHCSASFCATRHRNSTWSARRQGLGRSA